MKHISVPQPGSFLPVVPVQPKKTESPLWSIWRTLRAVHKSFEMNRGHISLLEALIKCCSRSDQCVVFASNRTLATSCAMAERSISRKISELEEKGLVKRRNSPNGKRYVRRVEGAPVDFYGIDLAPLLQRAEEFQDVLDATIREEQMCLALKDRIRVRLRSLKEAGQISSDDLTSTYRQLNRKLTSADFSRLLTELPEALETPRAIVSTSEMAACGSQNDRHQQRSEEEVKISEETPVTQILETYPEIETFAAEKPGSWKDLVDHLMTLANYMAIDREMVRAALKQWGEVSVVLTLAHIVQNAARIRRHGAYFWTLMLGRRSDRYDAYAQFELSRKKRAERVERL